MDRQPHRPPCLSTDLRRCDGRLPRLCFYLVYRKPKVACADGSYCAKPSSARIAKIGLWTATILVIIALGFPKLAPLFL